MSSITMSDQSFPIERHAAIGGYLLGYLESHQKACRTIDIDRLVIAAKWIDDAVLSGGTIFSCGNGGSAAISNTLQSDFGKGIRTGTTVSPRVISLSAETSTLTAIANDIGYDQVYSYQLESLMHSGDILIAVSSSGNSRNIIRALETCRRLSGRSILLCGFNGGAGLSIADLAIHVRFENYGIVEDIHQTIMHVIAQFLRQKYLPEEDIGRVAL